ncbi:MAG: hypothetical protein AAF991_13765, partial [Pseudomonadota bacterium]
MKSFFRFKAAVLALTLSSPIVANDEDKNPLAELPLRHIGPAITSGRISDFAFHPEHKHKFYVATA